MKMFSKKNVLALAILGASCGRPSEKEPTKLHGAVDDDRTYYLLTDDRLLVAECPEGRLPTRETCIDERSSRDIDNLSFPPIRSAISQRLEKNVVSLEAERQQIICQARDADPEILGLKNAIVILKEKVAEHTSEVATQSARQTTLKAKLVVLDRDLSDYDEELKKIQQALAQNPGDRDLTRLQAKLTEERGQIQGQHDQVTGEMNTVAGRVTELNAAIVALRTDISKSEATLTDMIANYRPAEDHPQYANLVSKERAIKHMQALNSEVSRKVYHMLQDPGITFRTALFEADDKEFFKEYFVQAILSTRGYAPRQK